MPVVRHREPAVSQAPRVEWVYAREDQALEDGLNRSQMESMAYLFARMAVGRPIENPDEIQAILRLNDSGAEAQEELDGGRPNVEVDLKQTRLESLYRAEVARHIRDVEWAKDLEMEQLNRDAIEVAAAALLRCGYCDEHAGLTAFLHAKRLQPEEQVNSVVHNDMAHVWMQLSHSGRRSPIVKDSWLDGSAMKSRDTKFAQARNEYKVDENRYAIDHEDREMATALFTVTYARLKAEWGRKLPSMIEEMSHDPQLAVDLNTNDQVDRVIWSATSVAHPVFVAAAKAAIERLGTSAIDQAAKMAQEVLGVDEETAYRAASSIIDIACHLDRTSARGHESE